MTLEKAREILSHQIKFGGGYNRNATRVLLAEIGRVHGQGAVDALIAEFDLQRKFGLELGKAIRI